VTIEEPPQRTDADRRAALGQLCLQLDERDVILGLDRTKDEGSVRFDPPKIL